MKAASTLALLAKYKVESSRSRPRVSNDNPFIESLFKTMKYRGYMGKRQYHSLEDARTKLAPESRFKGIDRCIQVRRQLVLLQTRERNPSRWIRDNVPQFRMASSQFLNPDRPSRLIGSSPEGHLMEGTRVSGEQAVHWPKAA